MKKNDRLHSSQDAASLNYAHSPGVLLVKQGQRLMGIGVADAKHHAPIHREAPSFVEQSTEQEILATGIKALATLLPLHPLPTHCATFTGSAAGRGV